MLLIYYGQMLTAGTSEINYKYELNESLSCNKVQLFSLFARTAQLLIRRLFNQKVSISLLFLNKNYVVVTH